MIKHSTEERVKGEIADYYFDQTDGILYAYSKKTKRTVQLIQENIKLVQSIVGNKPVPLLIYLCNSPVPDKATRTYSTQNLAKVYSAMAMVSKPGLSQYIMNILFRFSKPPIPMCSFVDDRKARKWLQGLKHE